MGDQIVEIPDTRRYAVGSAVAAGLGQFAYNYAGQLTQQAVDRVYQRGFQSGRTQTTLGRKIGPIGPMPAVGSKRKFGVGMVARSRARGYSGSSAFTGTNKGKKSRVKQHKTCKTGYEMEHEIRGDIRDKNCARVGVLAYPVDQMLSAVWIAVIRYMLKKVLNLEFYSVDQFIESEDVLAAITIEYQAVNSKTTVTSQTYNHTIQSGVTTLKSLSEDVARRDLLVRSTSEMLPYRIKIVPSAGNIPALYIYPGQQWYRIDKLLIRTWGSAEINIQNVSASTSNPDIASTSSLANNVYNVPLTGNVVFGRGQTISAQIRGRTNANTANDNDFPFAYEDHGNGVITAGALTSGTWRAVQPAGQFNNAKYQQSLNLNPGECKTFKLGYKFTGYLSSFLKGYFQDSKLNEVLVPNRQPYHMGTESGKPGMNKWCLIQLEKRVDVFDNGPRIWYQVDHHLGARVVKGVRAENMNVDFGQATKSSVFT